MEKTYDETFDIKKAKKSFFLENFSQIYDLGDKEILTYVEKILNDEGEIFKPASINFNSGKGFFYDTVLYACLRDPNRQPYEYFHSILEYHSENIIRYNDSFLYRNASIINPEIRQCRPSSAATRNYDNIGFYNKNPLFHYKNYSEKEVLEFLESEYGLEVVGNYKKIKNDESKSDFFLVAMLIKCGGVSSDVCSIAESDITPLIGEGNITLLYDDKGINKKFLFSKPYQNFFIQYFSRLNNKSKIKNIHDQRTGFSDRTQMHEFFLDYFCFFKAEKERINFIHSSLYDAFIKPFCDEEKFFSDASLDFHKKSIKGIFRNSWAYNEKKEQSIIVRENFYTPSCDNVKLVGKDLMPHITLFNKKSYALSTRDVYEMKDVYLSGHAALWQDGFFLDLESDLCTVAEDETRAGFWKKPDESNVTNYIEDPCIVAFSPGYGCYGHYLVDDLPRIGLLREAIGNMEFQKKKFIVPNKIPKWGLNMLKLFFDLNDENFILFDHENDVLKLENVTISSYLHKNYNFHPYIREFYKKYSFYSGRPFRKVCLSRKAWEPTKQGQRVFLKQKYFEEVALEKGYEVIEPEKLTLKEQIKLMQETCCQIGEHGSAQHSSVFNGHGMVIGTIHPRTQVQIGIGRIYGDENIICYADTEEFKEGGNIFYDISAEKIISFFDEVEKKYIERYRSR